MVQTHRKSRFKGSAQSWLVLVPYVNF